MAQIDIEDLTFTYEGSGSPSIKNVSLNIYAGEYVCVCGKSGSGKTTFLRQLKSVIMPSGTRFGKVKFCGVSLDDMGLDEQARRIGYVAQDVDAQLVTENVYSELAFGLENLGVKPSIIRLRVAEMANYLGIHEWLHKKLDSLSGGQKQLVNLASILVMHPDVLVLDEPTGQLDSIAAYEFLNVIDRLNADAGTTVIIAEHRLEEIYAKSNKVVVFDDGRMIVSGTPDQVTADICSYHPEMKIMLPAAVQVYSGVCASEIPVSDIPATVREGRSWLAHYADSHGLRGSIAPDNYAPQPQYATEAVRLKDIWFRYDRNSKDVLQSVNLDIAPGCLFAILGGNGTGKTTILNVMCGISAPYRGSLTFFGQRVPKGSKARDCYRDMSMLPQNPKLLFTKETVREELTEMCFDIAATEVESALEKTSFLCGIENLLGRNPMDLSCGEQQWVAFAKLLLRKPKLMLLDEPTKGMDCFAKQKLALILQNLAKEGLSIVMASHDVEFCARYATEAAMLSDGQIQTTGTPRELFSSNYFYTTAAHRMSQGIFEGAITTEGVMELCLGA